MMDRAAGINSVDDFDDLGNSLTVEELASTALEDLEDGNGGEETREQNLGSGKELEMGSVALRRSKACLLEINGKQLHKASLCRYASVTFHVPLSTDRLRRVRAQHQYEPESRFVLDSNDGDDAKDIQVNDPGITIVCVEGNFFLACIRVTGIRLTRSRYASIPVSKLETPSLVVSGQIMRLVPRKTTLKDESDWLWDSSFERTDTLDIPGYLTMPINPKIAIGEGLADDGGLHELRFDTESILSVSHELLRRSERFDCSIPHIKKTDTFPYRYEGQ